MSKVIVLLAPGFEEIEAVTIIDLLRRGGVEVSAAGLEKPAVKGSHDISIIPDMFYKDVKAEDFDMLVLPGGQPGTNNLKADQDVLQLVKNFIDSRKNIAAICAAPVVLQTAGIVNNLKITSYPSEKEIFKDSDYREENVVEDGLLITSRSAGTAIEFSLKLLEKLEGPETALDVKEKILFK